MSSPSLKDARKAMLRLLALFPVPRQGNRPCEVHNYLTDVSAFLESLPAKQVELENLAARVSMLEATRPAIHSHKFSPSGSMILPNTAPPSLSSRPVIRGALDNKMYQTTRAGATVEIPPCDCIGWHVDGCFNNE